MKTMSWFTPWIDAVGLVVLALALPACANSPQEDVVGARGALAATPPVEVPIVEAPVVVDTGRVDRAEVALAARIATVADPEERMTARFDQFHTAQADVMRDGELDRNSVLATQAAIRARLLDTPEARRDDEDAERARRARGEALAPTPADLASFEEARAHRDTRTATTRVAAVPLELRVPEGIATRTIPPTSEEFRHETH
jgi:hypothetical protein